MLFHFTLTVVRARTHTCTSCHVPGQAEETVSHVHTVQQNCRRISNWSWLVFSFLAPVTWCLPTEQLHLGYDWWKDDKVLEEWVLSQTESRVTGCGFWQQSWQCFSLSLTVQSNATAHCSAHSTYYRHKSPLGYTLLSLSHQRPIFWWTLQRWLSETLSFKTPTSISVKSKTVLLLTEPSSETFEAVVTSARV